MSLKVTKNTIDKGLNERRQLLQSGGRRALDAGARVSRIAAARNTPVDTSRLVNSFRAQDSLQVTQGKLTARMAKTNKPQSSDVVQRYTLRQDRYSLEFGSGVPYAKFVEFGTSKQRPRYFFSESFRGSFGNMVRAIGRQLYSSVFK